MGTTTASARCLVCHNLALNAMACGLSWHHVLSTCQSYPHSKTMLVHQVSAAKRRAMYEVNVEPCMRSLTRSTSCFERPRWDARGVPKWNTPTHTASPGAQPSSQSHLPGPCVMNSTSMQRVPACTWFSPHCVLPWLCEYPAGAWAAVHDSQFHRQPL